MNIAQHIKSLLPYNGCTTIAEVEKAAKISNGSIRKWGTGEYGPTMKSLDKLPRFFNMSVDYLLGTKKRVTPDEEQQADSKMLIIPEVMNDVRVAFNRKEFKDLKQDEIDKIAEYAAFLKSQRKE